MIFSRTYSVLSCPRIWQTRRTSTINTAPSTARHLSHLVPFLSKKEVTFTHFKTINYQQQQKFVHIAHYSSTRSAKDGSKTGITSEDKVRQAVDKHVQGLSR